MLEVGGYLLIALEFDLWLWPVSLQLTDFVAVSL